MAQETDHVFTISKAITPSSIVAIGDVVFKTQDSQNKDIDGVTDMKTDAIAAGALTATSFATATDTPGFASIVTVGFTTAGRVEIGGKVELVLPAKQADGATEPQDTWSFENNAGAASTASCSPRYNSFRCFDILLRCTTCSSGGSGTRNH